MVPPVVQNPGGGPGHPYHPFAPTLPMMPPGARDMFGNPANLDPNVMVQYQIAKVLRKLVKSRKDPDDSDASDSDEECRREKSAMRGVLRLRKRVK